MAKMSTQSPEIKKSKLMNPCDKNQENKSRWKDVTTLIYNKTFFGNEKSQLALGEFEPGDETFSFINEDCKVLVIGAGGLGCEILKDLALSCFTNIEVIDMDRVDVTNLNRQFLFREKDIDLPKAEVAANFINSRIEGVNVVPHYARIQDFDADFYRGFNIVISGLDNIDARRWLNSMLVSLVDVDEDGNPDPGTIIPLIDGGTEGWNGQARVILPRITSCFECSLDSFPPQTSFPICTIAETPRIASHCIAYASLIQWPKQFPETPFSTDSPEHVRWVYSQALERAEQFGIAGVTFSHTLGVVKNIIPAVASTNATIAAICVNEVIKLMSYCSQTMNNYHMYMGLTGIYSHTFEYGKKEDCGVCSSQERIYWLTRDLTLEQLLDKLKADSNLRLQRPSISKPGMNLFMQGPPALKEATEKNLKSKMDDLVQDGDTLSITDPVFVGDIALSLTIKFK